MKSRGDGVVSIERRLCDRLPVCATRYRSVAAIRSANACAWPASQASTITRTTGLVPLGRIGTLPWSPRSASSCAVAVASAVLVFQFCQTSGPVIQATLTRDQTGYTHLI